MSIEIQMLLWATALTAVMWVPYISAHVLNVGLLPALTYQADSTPLPEWAARAKRAHYNAIENLAPFAALVIVADLLNVSNGATAAAAVVYVLARVVHYVLYIANVPFGRTITFTIGWLAMVCILWQIVATGGGA